MKPEELGQGRYVSTNRLPSRPASRARGRNNNDLPVPGIRNAISQPHASVKEREQGEPQAGPAYEPLAQPRGQARSKQVDGSLRLASESGFFQQGL